MGKVLIESIVFAFFLALPIGCGSIKMLQNGLNKSPIHAFYTGTGINFIDLVMFALYYFGLSKIFEIHNVQIIIYIAGMFILSKLAFECFCNIKIKIGNGVHVIHAKPTQSLMDGIMIALVPSSIIYWTATYGIFLSDKKGNAFFVACIGILIGFFFNNIAYGCIAHIIKKYANQTIIKWVNIVSGTVLFGFAIYFMIKLILL